MTDPTRNVIDECRRQEESCLYTSTALFEWVKVMRRWKIFFVVAPIALAGIATGLPAEFRAAYGWVAAVCTLLAGIGTAVYKALDFDVNLELIAKQANEFKVLQDAFRQSWRIEALGDANAFAVHVQELMDRLDTLRLSSLPPPERFFRMAQAKVESGDYEFTTGTISPFASRR